MPGDKKHHSAKMRSCVEKVMADGKDESAAYAICTASLQEAGEEIFEAAEEMRHFHLRGALGRARTEMWEGREHLVIPVIALQEGVIHAVNAAAAEFVPERTLAESYSLWNGHPIMVGHPVRNGTQVSAHDRELQEKHGFGLIRMARMNGKRLGMEVLADPARLEALGEVKLLADLRAGNPVEVSVGVFARVDGKPGEYNGKRYAQEWVTIIPDHLAFLPGQRGACSLEMGCGANRAAEAYEVTETEFKELAVSVEKSTLSEQIKALLALAAKYEDCEMCGGSGSKDGNPCPACDGDGVMKTAAGARNSAADLDRIQSVHDKTVELGAVCSPKESGGVADHLVASGTVTTLERPTEIVAAAAAATIETPIETPIEVPVIDEAARAAEVATVPETAAASEAALRAACSCQGESSMTPEQKADVIKSLVADRHSGFTAGDEEFLALATDERLESFRVAAESRRSQEVELKAAAEKRMTPEEWTAAAPPEIRSLVESARKQEIETKAALITELKTAQAEYSEAELSVMPVEQLQRMARMQKIDVARLDYSGRGLPRAAGAAENDYTPPNPYASVLKSAAH